MIPDVSFDAQMSTIDVYETIHGRCATQDWVPYPSERNV